MSRSTILNQIFTSVFSNSLGLVNIEDNTSQIATLNANLARATPEPITGFEICHIPPQGLLLSNQGTYRLKRDVKWEPTQDAIALTIVGNNIILDLKGHKIKAENKNNLNLIGISVTGTSVLNNIKIKNGELKNMSYYGVQVTSAMNVELEDIIVDGLNLENLTVRNLTPTGVILNHVDGFTIENCVVKNIDVKTDSSAGLQMIFSNNGNVFNCEIDKMKNRDGAIQGFSYILSTNINTFNCKSKDFKSEFNGNILTTGHTVLGFIPILCVGLTYDNCYAENMVGCCDDVHGISVFLNANIIVTNCYVENVIDGITETKTGAKSTGIEVYGNNVTVSHCRVKNIKAVRPQDFQCSGFSVTGQNNQFIDCEAIDVQVLNKHHKSDEKYGLGVGFGWAPDPRPELRSVPANTILYKNCKAVDCQVGFDSWDHVNSLWYGVSTKDCKQSIRIEPYEKRTLSCDACSECNPPIEVTLTNIAVGNKFVKSKKC